MKFVGRCAAVCASTVLILVVAPAMQVLGQTSLKSAVISVDLNQTIIVSRSTPTLQVVVNPMLAKGSLIHDGTFAALKDLGADFVRYVPWEPYPKLSVAELDAPTKQKTSWDFSLIDPYTVDFLAATEGHSTVMNFSTIPAWMFKVEKPVAYPAEPNQVFWDYTQGTELTDPSGKQAGDYFARLVSWYTRGGFTDENGKVHTSGYHYKFPVWEVLNEVDMEHHTTPELYTARYDAIVEAVRKVSPDTKFMGLALADAAVDPRWYEYFLNAANHKPGIPLDYISYHFYAQPAHSEDLHNWQYSFFNQADNFLTSVRFIESIRRRLSPATKTDTDELGIILPTDLDEISQSKANPDHIPRLYWNAAGSMFSYLFIHLAKEGIDVIGESQLVGYPSQFPSVSMMDWTNGKPNARYWVLKLLKDNFHPGDKLVETSVAGADKQIEAQAFVTPTGKRLLIANKRMTAIDVTLPEMVKGATIMTVDEASEEGPVRSTQQSGPILHMEPFAVSVVIWQ